MGAAALLVGERPATFQLNVGASGYCDYEVMDARGPVPDSETADADFSLMSFMDYREGAFGEYPKRVIGADYLETFHNRYGGMVKGAHRSFQARSDRKWLSLYPGGDAYGYHHPAESPPSSPSGFVAPGERLQRHLLQTEPSYPSAPDRGFPALHFHLMVIVHVDDF